MDPAVIDSKEVISYTNLVLSPDSNKILIWTPQSTVRLVDSSTPASLVLQNTWTPQNIPSVPDCTQTISFSQDSSLAIVETDNFNPIAILNTSDLSEVHTIDVFEAVQSAHFVNSSNFFVVIFGETTTFFVDLDTGGQYQLTHIPAKYYTTDLDNHIFTCNNNVIEQRVLSYYIRDPNSELYRPLKFTMKYQEVAYETINNSLTYTT